MGLFELGLVLFGGLVNIYFLLGLLPINIIVYDLRGVLYYNDWYGCVILIGCICEPASIIMGPNLCTSENCNYDVETQLFKSYCSHFDAAHIWCHYKKKSMGKVRVAFNNIVRSNMVIKLGESISLYYMNNDIANINNLLQKSIYQFNCECVSASPL